MVSRTPDASSSLAAESTSSAPISGSTDHKLTRAPRFELGSCFATAAVAGWAEQEGIDITDFLQRHLSGKWGDLCDEDKAANEKALKHGHRILSRYQLTGRYFTPSRRQIDQLPLFFSPVNTNQAHSTVNQPTIDMWVNVIQLAHHRLPALRNDGGVVFEIS